MPTISAFLFVTANGFFKGPKEDTSWHAHTPALAKFSEASLQSGNILLFGRKTYEMMQHFWPTPMAAALFPEVAKGMNLAGKIVFSNTLRKAEWENTTIISGNIIDQIKKRKAGRGKNMTILGSGSIVSQLADAGLLDEISIMIDPLVLAKGTPLFDGIRHNLGLQLIATKIFKKAGVALLTYKTVK